VSLRIVGAGLPRVGVALILLFSRASPLRAQDLVAEDTAAVVAAAFRQIAGRFGRPFTTQQPTWFRDGPAPNREGTAQKPLAMSDRMWQAFDIQFDGVRRATLQDTLVVCGEGQRHVMPGGCPVRGGGRIISSSVPVCEDRATCVVTVVVIDTAAGTSYSYGGRYRLRWQGASEGWVVSDVLDEWIT